MSAEAQDDFVGGTDGAGGVDAGSGRTDRTGDVTRLQNESVLITGGAGFIGTALTQVISSHVRELIILDSFHPDVHGLSPVLSPPEGAHLIRGDVAAADVWDNVLAEFHPSVIVHLAAETGTGQSLRYATRHGFANVIGTTAMTDALLRHDHIPRHVLLASSRAVYGEGRWSNGDETYYPGPRRLERLKAADWNPGGGSGDVVHPLPSRADKTEPRPTNIYAATKLAQEHILGAWTAATGAALSILRLQNVYGPGQSLSNPYTGILALFSRLSAEKHPIDLYEDGQIIRDFVYIEDVVQAMVRALGIVPDQERLLDVGSGRASTLSGVADLLARLACAPRPFVSGKFREGDVRAAWCDIAASGAELGYSPAYSLEDGLSALLRWVRTVLEDA